MRIFKSDSEFCSNVGLRVMTSLALAVGLTFSVPVSHAAELSNDAKAAIPHDVQQIIVVDYRAMQNSPAAMNLKDKVMPPELKRLDQALKTSGLKVDQDADTLAFAAFRVRSADGKAPAAERIVGVAQGQFRTREIQANWTKQKVKPLVIRNNSIYPMGSNGFSVVFLNQTTMIFGDKESIKAAVDARDGFAPSFMTDTELFDQMNSVDSHAVWSLLDAKGTQTMMKSILGEAAQVADYDTVKERMKGSRYTLDFSNGVTFNMAVNMSDNLTAATAATLLKGVEMLRKAQGTPQEKAALDDTNIDFSAGSLTVSYSASDSQFASLLTSPLFQAVVR